MPVPIVPIIVIVALLMAVNRRSSCGARSLLPWFVIVATFVLIMTAGVSLPLWFATAARSIKITTPQSSVQVTPSGPRNSRVVVRASATGPATQADKAWLNDWSKFVNSTNWRGFRAESGETCVTEDEARSQALATAEAKLYQLVSSSREYRGNAVYRLLSQQLLHDRIRARLESGEFIADQSIRPIEKPYATLYKVSLLVDASPANVDSIIKDFQAVATATANRQLTTWGSLGALALLIVLLYAFLNAATKGYFVWRLRAAAMMVLIVALLVIMAMV